MAEDLSPTTIRWHRGFRGSMKMLLWEYRDQLKIQEEIPLRNDVLHVDLLIHKITEEVALQDSIGKLFQKHNIIEYKSNEDALNLFVLLKVAAYGTEYWSKSAQEELGQKLAVFIFRHAFPRELFHALERLKQPAKKESQGIYYVEGFTFFPIYIVVCKELDSDTYAVLRVLVPNARESDIENFLLQSVRYQEQEYKDQVDAVLQISSSANGELFEQIRRRHGTMFDVLKELLRDEWEEEKTQVVAQVTAQVTAQVSKQTAEQTTETIARRMILGQESMEKIMDFTKLPYTRLLEIAKSVNVPLPPQQLA